MICHIITSISSNLYYSIYLNNSIHSLFLIVLTFTAVERFSYYIINTTVYLLPSLSIPKEMIIIIIITGIFVTDGLLG